MKPKTHNQKKQIIKKHVKGMLKDSYASMLKKIDKALNSGAIDIENYDVNNAPMIIPKCIVIAILQDETEQYSAKGTAYEKLVRRESDNIYTYL